MYQVYFKSWDGSLNNGVPPTGGGGGSGEHIVQNNTVVLRQIGHVRNAVFRNFTLDRVTTAVQILQDFGGG
jgi:hypothetical protein